MDPKVLLDPTGLMNLMDKAESSSCPKNSNFKNITRMEVIFDHSFRRFSDSKRYGLRKIY